MERLLQISSGVGPRSYATRILFVCSSWVNWHGHVPVSFEILTFFPKNVRIILPHHVSLQLTYVCRNTSYAQKGDRWNAEPPKLSWQQQMNWQWCHYNNTAKTTAFDLATSVFAANQEQTSTDSKSTGTECLLATSLELLARATAPPSGKKPDPSTVFAWLVLQVTTIRLVSIGCIDSGSRAQSAKFRTTPWVCIRTYICVYAHAFSKRAECSSLHVHRLRLHQWHCV